MQECLLSFWVVRHVSSWSYEKNHPTQVGETNCLLENGFIPLKWGLTSSQVRSHLGGTIFFHVSSFCGTVLPRPDCSFSLESCVLIIFSWQMQLILYVCSVWIFISDSKLNEKYFTQVRRPTYVTAPKTQLKFLTVKLL